MLSSERSERIHRLVRSHGYSPKYGKAYQPIQNQNTIYMASLMVAFGVTRSLQITTKSTTITTKFRNANMYTTSEPWYCMPCSQPRINQTITNTATTKTTTKCDSPITAFPFIVDHDVAQNPTAGTTPARYTE